MNRLTIAPAVRGSYLEGGKEPVIVLSEDTERTQLPELKVDVSGDTVPGAEISAAVRALVSENGEYPAGVRIAGAGSFYAGTNMEAAQAAKAQGASGKLPESFKLADFSCRSDVVRGKISLVTGGAQGFGAEIVKGLVKAGSFVIIADLNFEGAKAFADSLNADGPKVADAVAVDVSSEESVSKMAETIVETAGGLDVLVSNAGVLRAGSVLELSKRDFDFVTGINYSAFFIVVKHTAPVMIRQQSASPMWKTDIIQINSKSGLEGSNKNGAYAGSKFGGIGLVQSFAMELVEYGVKVNAVCPGNFFDGPLWSDPEKGLFVQYLNTGKVPGAKTLEDVRKFYEAKVPMNRGCEGADVLRAILYCVEQEYETGQAVPVTGGQVMLK